MGLAAPGPEEAQTAPQWLHRQLPPPSTKDRLHRQLSAAMPLSPAFSSPDKTGSPSLPTFEDIGSTVPRTNMAATEAALKKPLAAVKPSLDDVKDDSIVALTNKHGKGKYWFKSGCPTPDPRWPARQQLMIGPIPGDVEYATLRSAFLSKGERVRTALKVEIIF